MDETRNCPLEQMKNNEWISRKHKNICTTLNHIEHLLIWVFAVTECVSISALLL